VTSLQAFGDFTAGVLADVLSQEPLQILFVDDSHVIQEIASAAAVPALADAVLPRILKWRPRGAARV
jgi:hypothetical protein